MAVVPCGEIPWRQRHKPRLRPRRWTGLALLGACLWQRRRTRQPQKSCGRDSPL